MASVLRLEDHLQEGAYFSASRQRPGSSKAVVPALHSHEFHEIFWVESGEGVEYTNESMYSLTVGDLIFVAPDDHHGFGRNAQSELTICNIAFPSRHWEEMRTRHGKDFPDFYEGLPAKRRQKVNQNDSSLLMRWGNDLTTGRHRAVDVERFLLNLSHLIVQKQEPGAPMLPDWLGQALEFLHDPKHFMHGAPALATLSKRSPEHVARAVRRYLGCTPTDVVNGIRLEWAAERLVNSHDDILSICLGCGWDNLGYFYRQFQKRFGTTPKRWRQKAWGIAGLR